MTAITRHMGGTKRRFVYHLNFAQFRNTILLILIGLYFLLDNGFMQLRLPLGIPFGELILLFSLLTINHRAVFPRFCKSRAAIPFLIWWMLGFFFSAVNIPKYGYWAVRDAGHIIESLYFYVGFAFAANAQALDSYAKWLPRILLACGIYSLTYPFRDFLISITPSVTGFYGQPIPLFFSYVSTTARMVVLSAYLLNRYLYTKESKFLYGAIIVTAVNIVLFPARTLYLEIIALFLYFGSRIGLKQLKKIASAILLTILAVAGVVCSGIPINGRFGEGLTLSNYIGIFLEMLPGNHVDVTYTSGTEQRLGWWAAILNAWIHSAKSIVFGMGYGFPLIDFQVGNVVVREPHNDIISILVRGGVVSLSMFFWFQAVIMLQSWSIVKALRKNPRYRDLSVILFFIILCTLIYAVGEPPFVLSFFTIPYYFAAGVLLRLYLLRKEETPWLLAEETAQ